MMKGLLSTILLAILSTAAFAQDYHLTDSVKKNLEQAKTAAEKIKWMGELAGFYMNLNNQLAEQYGKQQIEVAELSRDREHAQGRAIKREQVVFEWRCSAESGSCEEIQ
jgi:hypothetical protein